MALNFITFVKDKKSGDWHVTIAPSAKRLLRLTKNTFSNNGSTYITIKVFKKMNGEDNYRMHRISLTATEFRVVGICWNDWYGSTKRTQSLPSRTANKYFKKNVQPGNDLERRRQKFIKIMKICWPNQIYDLVLSFLLTFFIFTLISDLCPPGNIVRNVLKSLIIDAILI